MGCVYPPWGEHSLTWPNRVCAADWSMVFKDLSLELPSPLALLFRAANAFRVTWSEPQIRHRSELTEEAWEMPYKD